MLGLESQVELGLQTSPTGFATVRQALNVYKITGGQTRSRPEDPILNAGFENLTDPTEPGPGLPDHKVTVEVPLCIAQFPFWLRSFFGAPTTSGEDPDLEHAFKSGRALQYASIQHRLQSGDYRRHVGLVGEEMKIALNPEADGFARVTITYVGIDEERDTATAADGEVTAEPALDRPAEALAKVIWNAIEGGQLIGGELTFKRNLKRIRAADGTGKPSRIEYNGKSSLTGSVRLRYADQTIIADAWSRTERALSMELMREVGRGVKFLCGQALLDETPIGADGPDGVEVDVPLMAYQSPGAPALTVTALTEVYPAFLAGLTLEPAEATVGVAYSGLIAGRTAGSTLTLTGAGSAGLSVNNTTGAVTGTPTAAGPVNIVETLAGAVGSPRTTPNALETGVVLGAPALVNFDVAHLPKLLTGLKDVQDGASNLRMIQMGHSIPQAFRSNAAISTVQDQYGGIAAQAFSAVAAGALESALGITVRTSGWFGDAAGATSSSTSQTSNTSTARWRSDTRMTAYTAGTGHWIGQSGSRLGGNRLRNVASTNRFRYTDAIEVDTVETYYSQVSTGGTLSIAAANGSAIATQDVTGTDGTPAKLVTPLGSRAIQSADAWRSAGTVDVSGQVVYDSTIKQAIFLNAAKQGSRIANWIEAAPLAQLALYAPDVIFMQIDLNEWLGDVAPAAFKADYQTWITAALALASAPDIVLMVSSTPNPATVRAYPWEDYRTAIYELAQDNDLALIDWGLCVGYSYDFAVDQDFIQPLDGLHWLAAFHTYAGGQLASAIASRVPA